MSAEPNDSLDLTLMPGGTREAQMRAGVRTVNAKPMMIVGGMAVAVTVLIGSIMMGRSTPPRQKGAGPVPDTQKISAMQLASSVLGDAKDGTEVARTGAPPDPMAYGAPASSNLPVDLDTPPLPAGVPAWSPEANAPLLRPGQTSPSVGAAREGDRGADQRSQDVQMQRTAAFLDALKAPPKTSAAASGGLLQKVQDSLPQPAATLAKVTSASGGLTDQEKLVALQQMMARQAAQGIEPSPAAKAEYDRLTRRTLRSKTDGYASFDSQGGDRWASGSGPEAPVSPFELRAGFVIPGVMITGVSSELPGQIEAQVAQNVYDTATGRYLLIPQGSRLVGAYQSNAAYGQARVLIAWQRVVFPDGKALDIGAMPGADSGGYAGFHDQVNNHYTRIFGSAVMLSQIGAGAEVGSPQASSTLGQTTTVSQALSQQLAQQLGSTATQMVQKNLSIAPTLKIRPGYRFNVVVTKDLVFRAPYQAFDYRSSR